MFGLTLIGRHDNVRTYAHTYTHPIPEREKKTMPPATLSHNEELTTITVQQGPHLAYWSTSMGVGSDTSPYAASPPEG